MGKNICPNCRKKGLVLWENNASCLECNETITKEEYIKFLSDLPHDVKVIDYGPPDPTFRPGGISTTNQLVECPLCKNQYRRISKRGCFSGSYEPWACPKCNFPFSTNTLYLKLKKVI